MREESVPGGSSARLHTHHKHDHRLILDVMVLEDDPPAALFRHYTDHAIHADLSRHRAGISPSVSRRAPLRCPS